MSSKRKKSQAKPKRKFGRPRPEILPRKIFVLVMEGAETERQYFKMFNDKKPTVDVKRLKKGDASGSPNILKKMKDYLEDKGLEDSDEAWLVVDKDERTDAELSKLYKWSQEKLNYELALSNPCFEFWLLLHFEDGKGASDPKTCTKQLKKHIPNYNKGIEPSKFTDEGIKDAIERAEKMKVSFNDLLSSKGTTVYKLVENILKTREEK